MINFENFIRSKPIKVIYKIIQRDLMLECYWKILTVKYDDRLAQSIGSDISGLGIISHFYIIKKQLYL
jgi:hypothetical protein